jgi:hypothetical protein
MTLEIAIFYSLFFSSKICGEYAAFLEILSKKRFFFGQEIAGPASKKDQNRYLL